jgi:glycosyltransferase involved in cell wall biosynthesis
MESRPNRVIYFGSLDQRNGAQRIPNLINSLFEMNATVGFHVIGTGPCADEISKTLAKWSSSRDAVFHGYMEKQTEVDHWLRNSILAVAPYSDEPGLFTEFADPQKLKYYAANGIPIFMPRVAKAAEPLFTTGGAIELASLDSEERWAEQICELLSDSNRRLRASEAAYNWALQFNRVSIYQRTVTSIIDNQSIS